MPKATTIRMTKNEKVNANLHLAAAGLREVQAAIAAEFGRQHADFDSNAEFDTTSTPNKTLKKGLKMGQHSIARGTVPSVKAQFKWKPEYVKKRTDEAKKLNRRPYLYNAGEFAPHNPQITDKEGKPITHDDGTPKHRWEWTPYIEAGIENYMHNCLKSALASVRREKNENEVKYGRDGRAQEVYQVVQRLGKLQAFIEMDKTYYGNGARTLVSKRANPYHSEHYVMRGEGFNSSDSDYYTYRLLGLGLSWPVINKGRKILQLLEGMQTTYTAYLTKRRNQKYTESNVENYKKNVELNDTNYLDLINKVTDNGNISLEDAIKADNAKRAEVTEYFKNIPHADMIFADRLTPSFRYISVSERIIAAKNRIVQSKATLAREKNRLAEETSDLPMLEFQVEVLKVESAAKLYGLLDDGGEEE